MLRPVSPSVTGRMSAALAVVGHFALAAGMLSSGPCNPALAQDAKVAVDGVSNEGPGRGDLAGFVATPQTEAGGNRALLLAPNGLWFLATSPRAPGARLIDIKSGIRLRFLTKQGLEIAGLSIAADSKTVFAEGYDGQIVAWDAATGQLIANAKPADLHDITKLSFSYDGPDEESKLALDDLVSRYHLRSHFPELKQFDDITINPTQEYAIVGYVGDPGWRGFEIWNLKKEKREFFFQLWGDDCGYPPFAFDFDGKHLVYGNSGGESESNHLDFAVFGIDYYGPDVGPKTAAATPELGGCDKPSDGWEREFAVSPDARFITRGGGMPGSDEWVAWNLRNGKKVASIRPDGHGIVSPDGSTFAVLHDMQRVGSRSKQLMTVLRNGRQRTFEIPSSMQADDWRPLVLSANGKWIASQTGAVVAVWNTDGGRKVREYRVGDAGGDVLRLSNSGDPLLVNDDDGTAFVNGKWRSVRSDRDSLIVPLTPSFHPQCGAIFCDRVAAELGVVERKRVDHSAREPIKENLSPDGSYVITRLGYSEKGNSKGADISDVTDRHVVLHIDEERVQFTPDGRFLVVRDFARNFVKYDLATGQSVWTTIGNWNRDGFQMFLADGRVRCSPSKYRDFRLVRGFEIRPFDARVAKMFVAPPDR
jgi:WD40 repeat protein